jgi:hypothetical protein
MMTTIQLIMYWWGWALFHKNTCGTNVKILWGNFRHNYQWETNSCHKHASWRHDKVYTKISVSNKIQGSLNKMTSK